MCNVQFTANHGIRIYYQERPQVPAHDAADGRTDDIEVAEQELADMYATKLPPDHRARSWEERFRDTRVTVVLNEDSGDEWIHFLRRLGRIKDLTLVANQFGYAKKPLPDARAPAAVAGFCHPQCVFLNWMPWPAQAEAVQRGLIVLGVFNNTHTQSLSMDLWATPFSQVSLPSLNRVSLSVSNTARHVSQFLEQIARDLWAPLASLELVQGNWSACAREEHCIPANLLGPGSIVCLNNSLRLTCNSHVARMALEGK